VGLQSENLNKERRGEYHCLGSVYTVKPVSAEKGSITILSLTPTTVTSTSQAP